MQRPYGIRQGDRSEYLAHYILSALAITTPVPRAEDFQGIDFHCSLLKEVDGNLQPYAPFNVQVKSASEAYVEYGGVTKSGNWRKHEIEALCEYQTPFFIGLVNKDLQRLDLFQTINRAFLWGRLPLPFKVRLMLNDPDGEGELGSGSEVNETVDPSFGCAPITHILPIGRPVVSIPIADSEDAIKIETLKSALLKFIMLDQENITLHRADFAHFRWPLVIKPGTGIHDYGIMAMAPNDPRRLLRLITPAIASLLSTYKHHEGKSEIEAWGSMIHQLPRDHDLALMGKIIDQAFEFARE